MGGSPIVAEKVELDLDDAGYVLAFCGVFKTALVVSTSRDDVNAKSRVAPF